MTREELPVPESEKVRTLLNVSGCLGDELSAGLSPTTETFPQTVPAEHTEDDGLHHEDALV